MSFEEKVLEFMAEVRSDIAELKNGQARLEQVCTKLEQGYTNLEQMYTKLEQGYANLEQMYTKLEQGQAKLEQGQARQEEALDLLHQNVARIEFDHGKMLGALCDGQSLHSEYFSQLRPLIPVIKQTAEDVSIIKPVITAHSKIFNAINEASKTAWSA